MKAHHIFNSILAGIAIIAASCTTPQLAQKIAIQDDVYTTTAQAKIYTPVDPIQSTSSTYTNEDDYRKSDPNYDMDYASRIDRFYYGNPVRGYYDPYYNYYGYNNFNSFNNFNNPYGFYYGGGLGGFYNNFYNNPYYSWYGNPYYNWGYYGSPYNNNFWGPYSYGGYLGGGGVINTGRNTYNPNYATRPNRGSENGIGRTTTGYYGGNGSAGISRSDGTSTTTTRSRAEMYNPSNGANASRPNTSSGTSSNTTRTSTSEAARPTRTNDAPVRSQPTYNPPVQQSSPPPSSSGGGSSSEGSSGSARPTRGGGK
jgi:hypothetical protein